MRSFLLEKEVPIKVVFQLEQEFIEAVLKSDKDKFAKESTIKGLEGDIRAVISSFIASVLFKMVFGS